MNCKHLGHLLGRLHPSNNLRMDVNCKMILEIICETLPCNNLRMDVNCKCKIGVFVVDPG